MVPSNVIQRTFMVKYGDGVGTCFTLDVDGRQYLITAKHVLEGISDSDTVQVFHDDDWCTLAVTMVGEAPNEADIIVLTPGIQLSPAHPLPPASTRDFFLGQDVYFVGFPYGLFTDVGEMNRNFPIPFVKKGVISSWLTDENGTKQVFLDGHNNPGFSGGPVVVPRFGTYENYKVVAVVSAYRFENLPVYAGDIPTELA
jgi:S1-C subfamily serine protease